METVPDVEPTRDKKSGWQPGRWHQSGNAMTVLSLPLVALVAGIFIVEQPEWKAIVGLLLMLVLLLYRTPVAVAMGLPALLGIFAMQGLTGVEGTLRRTPYQTISGWTLSVLPMFILMGILMWRSGSTDRMYTATGKWLNWLPGSLALTTNAAGGALAAASGSSLGITYALGRIGIPAMLSAGYPKRLAVASVMMGGSGGQLIPPSILAVVYAGVASTPVGDQLLAGLLPGVVLISGYSLAILISSVVMKGTTGLSLSGGEATWGERLRSVPDLLPIPVIVSVIVGGIYFGIFTATEAAAIGALCALVLLLVYRRRESGRFLVKAAIESVGSIGAIFFLLIGANMLSRFLAFSGLTTEAVNTLSGMDLGRIEFLLVLVVAYLVLGTFMEPLSMVLITTPVLLPAMPILGIDVIWFGAFVVLMSEIAVVTPPVGIILYAVHGMVQERDVAVGFDISLRDVFAATKYFVPIGLAVALVMIFWPDFVTVLAGGFE